MGVLGGGGSHGRFMDEVAKEPGLRRRWQQFRDALAAENVLEWLTSEGIEPETEFPVPEPVVTLPVRPKPLYDSYTRDIVILLADRLVGKAGRTTLVRILKGSRRKELLARGHDRNPYYGALRVALETTRTLTRHALVLLLSDLAHPQVERLANAHAMLGFLVAMSLAVRIGRAHQELPGRDEDQRHPDRVLELHGHAKVIGATLLQVFRIGLVREQRFLVPLELGEELIGRVARFGGGGPCPRRRRRGAEWQLHCLRSGLNANCTNIDVPADQRKNS